MQQECQPSEGLRGARSFFAPFSRFHSTLGLRCRATRQRMPTMGSLLYMCPTAEVDLGRRLSDHVYASTF